MRAVLLAQWNNFLELVSYRYISVSMLDVP